MCVALLRTFLFWGVKMQETVNQRIFHIRKLKGYTQADMARTLNMRLSTYAQAERKGKIKTDFLVKIADVLEVDVGYLLTGKENKVCDSEITAPAVITTEPTTVPEFGEKEDLSHLLSRISLTDGILTALLNISSDRRKAIYKLIILTVKHRRFDIISEVEKIEALLETKKDL